MELKAKRVNEFIQVLSIPVPGQRNHLKVYLTARWHTNFYHSTMREALQALRDRVALEKPQPFLITEARVHAVTRKQILLDRLDALLEVS